FPRLRVGILHDGLRRVRWAGRFRGRRPSRPTIHGFIETPLQATRVRASCPPGRPRRGPASVTSHAPAAPAPGRAPLRGAPGARGGRSGQPWLHPRVGTGPLRDTGRESQESGEPPLALAGVPLLPGPVPGPSSPGRVHHRPPSGLGLWVADWSRGTPPTG